MLPRTESYKTIAMHCRQKTICISASFPPFFMILIVFNSQEAHLSNGIRTRKNGYVLAEIWSAQAESKKHCNSFVRHCMCVCRISQVEAEAGIQVQGQRESVSVLPHPRKKPSQSLYVYDIYVCICASAGN